MESSDSPALVGYNVRFGAKGQNQNFKSLWNCLTHMELIYGIQKFGGQSWCIYMALSLKGSPDQRSYFGIPKGWSSSTHPAEIKLFWQDAFEIVIACITFFDSHSLLHAFLFHLLLYFHG